MGVNVADISELKRRIVIEQPTVTINAHGGQSKTWSSLRSCWAKVEPVITMEINENEDAKRLNNINLIYFYIKFWEETPITPEMRIKYRNKYYEIETVLEIGDFDFLLIKSRRLD